MPVLAIDIEAKFAQFMDAVDQIERRTATASSKMSAGFAALKTTIAGAFAALTAGAVTVAFQKVTDDLAALDDAAEKAGTTVENLSETFNKFRVGGGTLDELTGAATRLVRTMQGAGESSSGAGDAFKKMGISTRDASGNMRDSITVLNEIARAFETYKDGANKVALAQALFGKSGADLLPKLHDLATETARFGTITAEQAAKAEELKKALERLSIAADVARQQFASQFIPALERIVTAFNDARAAGLGYLDTLRAIRATPGDGRTDAQQYEDTGKAIQKLIEQREKYQKQLDDSTNGFARQNAKDQIDKLDAQITKERILYGLFQQRAAAAAANDPSNYSNEGRNRPKGDAPNVITAEEVARQKAVAEAQQRLQDTIAKIEFDAAKARGAAKLSILDAEHAQGLIGEKEYWAQRQQIAESAYDAEIALLNKQIQRQQQFRDQQAQGTKERIKAEQDLQESIGKRAQVEAARPTADKLDDLNRAEAARQYAAAIRTIIAQVKTLEGDSFEGAMIRFGVSIEKQQRELEANADAAGLKQLERLKALTAAQEAYTAEQQKAAIIQSNLAAAELRIRTAQETGAISEFEAMRQIQAEREKAVPQLQAIGEAIRKIPNLNPKLLADLVTFEANVDQIARTTDLLRAKVQSTFEDAFASNLADFVTGTKSAADAFKDFGKAVLTELIRMEAKFVASKLFGQGSGIVGAVTNLFGALNGTGVAANQGGLTSGAGTGLEAIEAKAVRPAAEAKAVNVTVVNQIDSRTDQAQIATIARKASQDAVNQVFQSKASGGWAYQ